MSTLKVNAVTNLSNQTPYQPTLMTAQASTSGTSIPFTGIPSWAVRITVLFNGVSTNGTANIQIQVGAGSIATSGYLSSMVTGVTGNVVAGATSTSGFLCGYMAVNTYLLNGTAVLTLMGSNQWVMSSVMTTSSAAAGSFGAGNYTASGAIDRLSVVTTDTFDAGSISVMYE